MGHTLWIHFEAPSASGDIGWVPTLSDVLKRAVLLAQNHYLSLSLDNLTIGLAIYDPAELSRGKLDFDFVDLLETKGDHGGECDWPGVVKAFFSSETAGVSENNMFWAMSGGKRAELQLRIRDRSPTPLILSAAHSFKQFAEMKNLDLDDGRRVGFEPDPDAAEHVHLGVKWKAMALPEDIVVAFCFLEAFAATAGLPVPSRDEDSGVQLYSEVQGPVRWELQIGTSISSERWRWAWKQANHHAVLNTFSEQLPDGRKIAYHNLFTFLPKHPLLRQGSRREMAKKFGVDIDTSNITDIDDDNYDDPWCDNRKQHRVGPLLLDDAVSRLFGPEEVKARHKIIQKLRFRSSYRVCNGCGKPEDPGAADQFRKCARCSDALYCGKDCQRSDWPVHKTSCLPDKEERVYLKIEGEYPTNIEPPQFAPAMKADRPLCETVIYIAKLTSKIYHLCVRDRRASSFAGPVVIPVISMYLTNRRGRYVSACPPWALPAHTTVDMLDEFLKKTAEEEDTIKPAGKVELASCYWHSGQYLYQQVYRCRDDCNVVIRCRIKKDSGRLSNEWMESSAAPLLDLRRVVLLFKK